MSCVIQCDTILFLLIFYYLIVKMLKTINYGEGRSVSFKHLDLDADRWVELLVDLVELREKLLSRLDQCFKVQI